MYPLYLISLCLLGQGWAAALPALADRLVCAADSRQIETNATYSYVWPWQTYRSSDATPPVLLTHFGDGSLFDGFIFFDTAYGTSLIAAEEQAPLIMTDNGDLVWEGPKDGVTNFRVQEYYGEPVLTYFSGQGTPGASAVVGHGYGEVYVLDSSYNVITTVCPQLDGFTTPPGVIASCDADVHESYITPRNTMLVSAYNTTPADLSSIGGPVDGWVLNPLAVEVNITTGDVLWMWSPLDHVPLSASHWPLDGTGLNSSNPYDFFHLNSIQPIGDNYLINSRHCWTTYLVNPWGEIIWEINGEDGGDFGSLPEGGHFRWEHFARMKQIDPTHAVMSYFANNNALPTYAESASTGLSLLLTLPPNPATPPILLANLTDPQLRVNTWSQGSHQHLPNGNSFMGYGAEPVMIEYAPMEPGNTEGTSIWTARFGYNNLVSSYRTYKYEWHATPSTQPSLVVLEADSTDVVYCAGNATYRGYVSWNGATDVTEWIVYAGATKDSLTAIGRAMKSGFETAFVIPNEAAFVQVGAVENHCNEVVRLSPVVSVTGEDCECEEGGA